MYGEILSSICEKLVDAEITFEQAEELVNTLEVIEEAEDLDSYTERANKEYKAELKSIKNKYKAVMKQLKKQVKNPSEEGRDDFYKTIEDAKDIIAESREAINNIPSDTRDVVTGYISVIVTDMIKWTIPALATAGLVGVVVFVRRIIEEILGIVKGINKEEKSEDALNLYRRRILEKYDKLPKQLDLLKSKYDKELTKLNKKKS